MTTVFSGTASQGIMCWSSGRRGFETNDSGCAGIGSNVDVDEAVPAPSFDSRRPRVFAADSHPTAGAQYFGDLVGPDQVIDNGVIDDATTVVLVSDLD